MAAKDALIVAAALALLAGGAAIWHLSAAPASVDKPSLVTIDTKAVPPRPAAAEPAQHSVARGPHWEVAERIRVAAGDPGAEVRGIALAGYRGQFACGEISTAAGRFQRFVWAADAGRLVVEGMPDFASLAPLCGGATASSYIR